MGETRNSVGFRGWLCVAGALGIGVTVGVSSPAEAGVWSTIPDPNAVGTSPDNPEDLGNANPSTEAAWLSALTGNTITEAANFISKNENDAQIDGGTLLDSLIPNGTFYAVLKQATLTYGFFCPDNACGDLVYQGKLGLGTDLSHATFFTPIPGAALLFGSALAGLAWMRRRKADEGVVAPAA